MIAKIGYSLDLDPCPFCGGEAWFVGSEDKDGNDMFQPQCFDCQASGKPQHHGDTVEETNARKRDAVAAWNRRVN